jgi:hypothetical protein
LDRRVVTPQRVDPWRLEAFCVFGGFRLALVRWELYADGWDEEHEFLADDATVYPTRDAAEAAILARRARVASAGNIPHTLPHGHHAEGDESHGKGPPPG